MRLKRYFKLFLVFWCCYYAFIIPIYFIQLKSTFNLALYFNLYRDAIYFVTFNFLFARLMCLTRRLHRYEYNRHKFSMWLNYSLLLSVLSILSFDDWYGLVYLN